MAQEVLSPLGFNPRLYYSTAKINHQQQNRYKSFVIVTDSTILVESDTLSLPFLDDFTSPSLKPYFYGSYIYAEVYNAIGPCLTDSAWTVSTLTDSFSFNQTYTYKYDTGAHKVDTIPNAPIVFLNSPGFTGDCFYNLGDTAVLYPLSYIDVFDSATGAIIGQFPDPTNVKVAITYAPVLYKSKAPLYTKWLDNNAYQNDATAYLPPSIGVATLDGLNAYGQPYNKSNPTNWGQADILTSKPINAGGLTDADSVYFSFFYQSGGFGDDPTGGDSLVLEFYNGLTSQWDHIWSVAGDSIATIYPDTPDVFHQVIIRLPTTVVPTVQYLFNGFQFRFLNYGSLTGNNDVWNIDYVRLDKNRYSTDTAIIDQAFQYPIPSILKNYTEMPARQYTGSADLADTLPMFVSNLNPSQAVINPPATQYTLTSNELYPLSSVVLAPTGNTFNAGLETEVFLFPSTQFSAPTPPAGGFDSLVIQTQAVLNISDHNPKNDTIRRLQTLSNVLAYDDGSAEWAYGVQNLGTNKFAYDYTLNVPDTLVGFQVLFSNIDVDVHDLVFEFNLWYRIDTGNYNFIDSPVYVSNNMTPYYIDSMNGFTTYKVAPIPLPTHFYFGYVQTDTRNLQIGYDLNSSRGRKHMFIYSSSGSNGQEWLPSSIYTNGSPMIRLLLGHSYQVPSGVKDLSSNPIKVYPNPTSGMLTFELPDAQSSYSLELYNMLGQMSLNRTLDQGNSTINISNLEQGIYMIRLTDRSTGICYQNKIVKSPKE